MDKAISFVSGGIGDQLYHFTQMQALASRTKQKRIDIACLHSAIMGKITQSCAWAGEVIDLSPARHLTKPADFFSFTKMLAQHGYSDAFIFHKSSSFKLASFLARIPNRTGLADGAGDKLMLTKPLSLDAGGNRREVWGHRPFIAAIDAHIETLLGHKNWHQKTPILPSSENLAIQQKRYSHLPRPWVVVNLFAQDRKRRWAIPHAAESLCRLHEEFGGTYFINAGPDARAYHQELFAENPKLKAYSYQTCDDYMDVQQDIALYHLADGYLGVDSFTANLALNCDLPCTTLFAKATDQLQYRSVCFPVFPAKGGGFSDLPISVICAELGKILSTRHT